MNWILVFCFTLLTSAAWATPPKEIQVQYDYVRESLAVEARHVSDDLSEHFIRRVVITSSFKDVEPQEFNFVKQVNPTRFEETVSYAATLGDTLTITLYCSEGGKGEEVLEIPAPTAEQVEEKKVLKTQQAPVPADPMAPPVKSSY
jgi:hypothetical protein